MNDDYLLRLQRHTPKTWVTPAVVGLNVAIWLLTLWAGADLMSPTGGDLLALGGNRLGETRSQPWRLLSATLLHAGIVHLALNMWALWDTGRVAERLFGNLPFLLIYVLAGLFGSIASLFFAGRVAVSVGASGAVFGVVGALLAVILTRPRRLPPALIASLRSSLLVYVGVSLFLGFTSGVVDNAAHLGGLTAGFVLAAVMPDRINWAETPGAAFARLLAALALAASSGWLAWSALA